MDKLKIALKILIVIFVLLLMIVFGSIAAVFYENWERDISESNSDFIKIITNNNIIGKKEEPVLEPNLTCLFMGQNQNLTDFIMLGQYNPNTREVSLLSIPRDTYVGSDSVDGKINSIYRGKYPEKVVEKVEEITGIEVQHYIVFDTSLLRKIVNEIGGVTVDVPRNMDYEDPYQNLYIHLKKGVQKLNGAQAEQLVRYRSGYATADIGRISTQQLFIKAMVVEVLKPANILKIPDLIDIVLKNTKTDITIDVVEEYIDDVFTFKSDRIRMDTLPGVAGNGSNGRAYYYLDEEAAKTMIEELFFTTINSESGDSEI